MAEKDLLEQIKEVAVKHFNTNGYHGSTIRNIAKDVNCSLPMIYYYYKSKKDLFDEIIKKDYFNIINRQASLLKINNDVIDFYTKFIFGLNALSDYDKQVYRLGIKVYLSFDGDEELLNLLDEWEKSIFPRHYQLLKPYLKNADNGKVVVRTLIHLLENMVENLIVKNRYLSEEQIKEEISIILQNYI